MTNIQRIESLAIRYHFWSAKRIIICASSWFHKSSIVLLIALGWGTGSTYAVPFYSIRSQSVNIARQMAGIQEDINRYDMDHIHGIFTLTPEYSQTYNDKKIANCLFGPTVSCQPSCVSSLRVQGSLVSGRDPHSWLADYFGLAPDFSSTIIFCPTITTFLVDIDFYIGLDELIPGVYFEAHAPLAHTRWNLHACEQIQEPGTLSYPAGYFATQEVGPKNLVQSALEFFSGNAIPTDLINDISVGTGNPSLPAQVTFQPLRYSKWANDCMHHGLQKTGLSDIEFALGWNFVSNEDYLFGLALRASAPTGNTPAAYYFFEPIIGSGGFSKVGVGIDFHSIIWRNTDETRSFGLYVHGNLQHLFSTRQKRTFDLWPQGTNSRYLLAQRLDPVPLNNPYPLQPANSGDLQYASEVAPVANLTTFNVDVQIALEADIAALFSYVHNNFGIDIGYNFYGRSCEQIHPHTDCCATCVLDGKTWALKGDSQVFGFAFSGVTPSPHPIALAATQSQATIYSGVNRFTDDSVRQNSTNIDSPTLSTNAAVSPTALPAVAQRSSGDPTIAAKGLCPHDIAFDSTQGISHKVFAHFNYKWRSNEDWTPTIGIGWELEFSSSNTCLTCIKSPLISCCAVAPAPDWCVHKRKGSCFAAMPSQWGIWVKGGVSFN